MLYPGLFSYCWTSISNKYVKQVALINHSWISPTLQKGWELEFCLFFKKWGRVQFSPRKGEVDKMQRNEGCWGRITYVYLLIFVFINPRNFLILGIYVKVTSFITHPNFWDKVLSKFQILYHIYIYLSDIASLFQEQTSLPNLDCGAHFQLNNHALFEHVDWN